MQVFSINQSTGCPGLEKIIRALILVYDSGKSERIDNAVEMIF
jgi:hypothetical protein